MIRARLRSLIVTVSAISSGLPNGTARRYRSLAMLCQRSEPIFSTGRMKPRLMRPFSRSRMIAPVEPLLT